MNLIAGFCLTWNRYPSERPHLVFTTTTSTRSVMKSRTQHPVGPTATSCTPPRDAKMAQSGNFRSVCVILFDARKELLLDRVLHSLFNCLRIRL